MRNKNTKEKSAYQQLLEKLDDDDFARQFKEEKQKEIEELISQILMVTSGFAVVKSDNMEEWGQESFFKIFDILMIRHKNFFIPDLLENLQRFLFSWTMKHNSAYCEWREGLEISRDNVSAEPASTITTVSVSV